MIANGQIRLMVFQMIYDQSPAVIMDLMKFLEHPPRSGSFCIHSVNGKISHAEKKETVKD